MHSRRRRKREQRDAVVEPIIDEFIRSDILDRNPEQPPITIDWNAVPVALNPEAAGLKKLNAQRKREQLESLAGLVLNFALPGVFRL